MRSATTGRFTYIKASPDETPALYQLEGGKPNLVDFDLQDGAFVVPKVLEAGYLAIGKKKLRFGLTSDRTHSSSDP